MSKGTSARMFLAGLLVASFAGAAYADRGGHGGWHGGGHFSGHGGFSGHPGFHRFDGGHFRSRVFIGGTFIAPFYYPPSYYQPYYYSPPPAPAPVYWWYCAPYGAYYPYVQDCPGGWQPVVPPPS